ncbi:MAG: hypothetical protein AB7G93_07590 [Bdellovibrionales bacterium]
MARALTSLGLSFQYDDFTKEERQYWLLVREKIETFKDAFRSEGNLELYEDRKNEADQLLQSIAAEKHCRICTGWTSCEPRKPVGSIPTNERDFAKPAPVCW